MTAPFAPILISPGQRGAAASAGVDLTFLYTSFDPGDDMDDYKIRRKQLAPTPGSYEYWNGSIWTTETYNALTAEDGDEVTISTGAWAANAQWEWGVKVQNAASEESPWSDPGLLYTHVAPSLNTSIANPALDSRPLIKWQFSGGTGRIQRSYRFAIYTDAETLKPGFDVDNESYDAVWKMATPLFSSRDSQIRPTVDFPSSGTYKLYGVVTDDLGLSSGWVLLETFTTNFTPPAAPLLTAVPDYENGYVDITAISVFNLLSQDGAAFTDGLGEWVDGDTVNAVLSYDRQVHGRRALVTFTGITYEDLAALYTDYDAEAAALTDHDDSRTHRSVTYSFWATPSGTAGTPVQASTAYSAVVSLQPRNRQISAEVRLTWYDSGGLFISTSTGPVVVCPAGSKKNVYVDNVTSPGTAAFVRLEVLIYSPGNVIGESLYMDNCAVVADSDVTWTAGGGNDGLAFVIQRSIDSGQTWVDLLDASYEFPAGATGQGQDRVVIRDRTLPLGRMEIQYRAYAVQDSKSDPVFSSPQTVTLPNGIGRDRWFLRSLQNPDNDMRAYAQSASRSTTLPAEVLLPWYADEALVVRSGKPPSRQIDLTVLLNGDDDKAKFDALMGENANLFLQRNVDEGMTIRPIGRIRWREEGSRRGDGLPHPVSFASFTAQILS